MQRPERIFSYHRLFRTLGLLERRFFQHGDERTQLCVVLANAIDACAGQLDGGPPAP